MVKKFYAHFLPVLLALAIFIPAYSQTPPPGNFSGIRGIDPPKEEPITTAQLKRINDEVMKNIRVLKSRGQLGDPISLADTVRFGWPLRQATGFNDPGYYGISNYIDWNPAANQVGDFNCGSRTYDGHRGTDVYTYPFPWHKQDENAVEVIAAADGVIVYKQGANPDKSCANCDPNLPTCQWNAIFVKSDVDGSIVWYGHLKKNSLTSKVVGDHVSEGEFLGIVGSSGNSTGPHLHFEVWKNGNYNWLYEPWAGPCNLDNNSSFWKNQETYYVPGINKVMTASAQPVFSNCYLNGEVENSHYKQTFSTNETIHFLVYGRDNLAGKVFNLKVIKPDGQELWNWNVNSFNVYYSSYWFRYFYPGSNFNIPGTWKFVATYEGKTAETEFIMTGPLPLNLLSFTGSFDGKNSKLVWQTSDEQKFDRFTIERSADGTSFENIGTVKSKGDGGAAVNSYEFYDVLPQTGINLYRLEMHDKDGKSSYSDVVNVKVPNIPSDIRILTNPVGSEIRFVCAADYKKATVKLVDRIGRTLSSRHMDIRRNQQVSMNTSYFATGTYYLVIEGNNKRLNRIFMKQ